MVGECEKVYTSTMKVVNGDLAAEAKLSKMVGELGLCEKTKPAAGAVSLLEVQRDQDCDAVRLEAEALVNKVSGDHQQQQQQQQQRRRRLLMQADASTVVAAINAEATTATAPTASTTAAAATAAAAAGGDKSKKVVSTLSEIRAHLATSASKAETVKAACVDAADEIQAKGLTDSMGTKAKAEDMAAVEASKRVMKINDNFDSVVAKQAGHVTVATGNVIAARDVVAKVDKEVTAAEGVVAEAEGKRDGAAEALETAKKEAEKVRMEANAAHSQRYTDATVRSKANLEQCLKEVKATAAKMEADANASCAAERANMHKAQIDLINIGMQMNAKVTSASITMKMTMNLLPTQL